MNWLVVLIPISLAMGLIGLVAFIWAMRHNQFEDLEGNAWRVIPTKAETAAQHVGDKS